MPTYTTKVVPVTKPKPPKGMIYFLVAIFRDDVERPLTTITTRHRAATDNRVILEQIDAVVQRYAKVDAGIIETDRVQEIAQAASDKKVEL